ncbi:MAG: hypothetical protein AAGA99_12750 [Actinomycetota bacterium]
MTQDLGFATWEARAVNLPEHAGNAIHTDAGARAAGFPAALVAGVDVYGYLTHLPVVAWGESWLSSGGAEVRFRRPVFDDDLIRSTAAEAPDDEGAVAVTGEVDGSARAIARFWPAAPTAPEARSGERLAPLTLPLEERWGRHGDRLGDDLPLYADRGLVHPVLWPHLANQVVARDLISGSWIHTRSIIRHHAAVTVGGEAAARATVVERFDSPAGERAVLDVSIEVDGDVVATLEHEAIVRLADRTD